MKKLGRSVTVIVFSLFVSSLLLLSTSTPFADPGSNLPSKPYLPSAATLPNADSSLSKKHLDNLMAGELALSRGDLKGAYENYSRVAKETQDPQISRRATEIALVKGDLPLAGQAALLWTQNDPTNLEAKLTVTAILIYSGDLKTGLSFLKQIEALKPQEASDNFLILYKQLEEPVARKHLVDLLEQLKTPNASIALSEIYLFQSEPTKALAYSEQAIKANPNQAQAIILYTQALIANNQLEKAKAFLDAQLQKHPNDTQLKFFYIQFYQAQNALDKAQVQIASLAKMKDLNAAELFMLARLSMEGKSFSQAESLLIRLEKMPEQTDLARYFLGQINEFQSKPKEAIQWYQKVENAPFYGIAHIRASLLYNELKEPTTALSILDNMEVSPQEERSVMLAKIEILASIKEYNKALSVVDLLLKDTPSDAELQTVRAAIVKKIGESAAKTKAPALIRQR